MIDKSYDCFQCGPIDFECLEVLKNCVTWLYELNDAYDDLINRLQ